MRNSYKGTTGGEGAMSGQAIPLSRGQSRQRTHGHQWRVPAHAGEQEQRPCGHPPHDAHRAQEPAGVGADRRAGVSGTAVPRLASPGGGRPGPARRGGQRTGTGRRRCRDSPGRVAPRGRWCTARLARCRCTGRRLRGRDPTGPPSGCSCSQTPAARTSGGRFGGVGEQVSNRQRV